MDTKHNIFWKIVSNPTVEVVAVLAVVSLAVWAMFNTADIYRVSHLPVWAGHM